MAILALPWAQRIRIQTVETLAHWTGRVNTRDLTERFGISRLIAQRDISRYLKLAPGNLSYHRQERAYLPTSIFTPMVTKGEIGEYLALEAKTDALVSASIITQIQTPAFSLNPDVVRPVLFAVRAEQGVRVRYRSLTHPKGVNRILFPHQLVNSGFRWHLRAYCDLRNDFRDFTLARIVSSQALPESRPRLAAPQLDVSWQTVVTLAIVPNPRLSNEEQLLLRNEFGIRHGGSLAVQSRACLVPYILQAYQIEPSTSGDDNPQKHRLVLTNWDDIRPCLWGE